MARPLLRLVVGEASPSTPPAPSFDDAQLLAAVRAGDEDAGAELHDRLRPRVDGTIRSILGPGHTEHQDLAQQSFVEIVLSLDRYRGECSLQTWAATISARTVFKFLRRRTTERKLFAKPDEDAVEPNSPLSVRRQLTARDLASRVRALILTMDGAKAEAFLLHDVCGFDAREVARIAKISEVAAHARIARGRRELHEKIKNDPELKHALVDLEVEP